jgi:hypothetical protein
LVHSFDENLEQGAIAMLAFGHRSLREFAEDFVAKNAPSRSSECCNIQRILTTAK